MSYQTMNLPLDIQWRRLCFSEDMIDQEIGDKNFPAKWKSSLAAFYYEPPEEYQNYEDRIISYIKISATITNFQPDGNELGLSDKNTSFSWDTPELIEELAEHLTFPCYGALLQVSVGPKKDLSVIEVSEPKQIDFNEYNEGEELADPYETENVTFSTGNPVLIKNKKNESDEAISHNGVSFKSISASVPKTNNVSLALKGKKDEKVLIKFMSEGNNLYESEYQYTGDYQTFDYDDENIDKISIENSSDEESILINLKYIEKVERKITINDYPYIMDFQPKKREMYETASLSNEKLSRSLEQINVRKGTTTSDSNEVMDIDRGWAGSQAANFTYGGTGGGGSTSYDDRKEVGTRNINTLQSENVRTTDTSKENREMNSFSTNINQIYHQLLSYHLGTNRCVFMMISRPRNVTSDITFIQGPVELQGIQEFFLIINRPSYLKKFCLEAYLETAHLNKRITWDNDVDIMELDFPKNLDKLMTLVDLNQDNSIISGIYFIETADYTVLETYRPPEGYFFDITKFYYVVQGLEFPRIGYYTDRNGNSQQLYVGNDNFNVKLSPEIIQISANRGQYVKREGHLLGGDSYFGVLYRKIRVYLKSIDLVPIVETKPELFITGRGICCCSETGESCYEESEHTLPNTFPLPGSGTQLNQWATYENKLIKKGEIGSFNLNGKATLDRIYKANTLKTIIHEQMIASLSSPKRYENRKVPFFVTDVYSKILGENIKIDDKKNNPTIIDIIKKFGSIINADFLNKLEAVLKKNEKLQEITRKQLLTESMNSLKRKFNMNIDEIVYLRAITLGIIEKVGKSNKGEKDELTEM